METLNIDPDDSRIDGLATAPEIFVEGYRGVVVRAGHAKLTFFSNRIAPADKRLVKQAVVSLVIPLEDLADVARALNDLVAEITASKGDPS